MKWRGSFCVVLMCLVVVHKMNKLSRYQARNNTFCARFTAVISRKKYQVLMTTPCGSHTKIQLN